MKVLEVAVVGSGPAGLYTAEALVKHAAALTDHGRRVGPVRVRVDVLDRLPTPYGLVRYGVAPDHKSIKSIAEYLRKVLESPDVRFLGGVHLGEDVTRADLLSAYDAVVYATGAMRDRRLGIPGEDLPGSYAATDFVNWYCGHPDVGPSTFTLDAESVAVIGVGNVAVDVARILARDPAELHGTDVPQPVLEALQASKVREVHMIGRRGPAHAKFTTKELRELGELPGVEVIVPATEADLDAFDGAGQGTAARRVRPAGPRQHGRDQEMGRHVRRPSAPAPPPPLGPGTPSVPDAASRSAPADGSWRLAGRARADAHHPVLAAAGGDHRGRAGHRARPRADPPGRERRLPGHRGTRDARRADGAALGGVPERSARRRPVRRARPPWCRTPLGACSDPTAPRCPASTWRAGSSAVPPA